MKVDKPTTKTVPVKGAKNGKERVVPINHDVSCVCVCRVMCVCVNESGGDARACCVVWRWFLCQRKGKKRRHVREGEIRSLRLCAPRCAVFSGEFSPVSASVAACERRERRA